MRLPLHLVFRMHRALDIHACMDMDVYTCLCINAIFQYGNNGFVNENICPSLSLSLSHAHARAHDTTTTSGCVVLHIARHFTDVTHTLWH